jgi:uncharacterized membrane protein YhaH (DUF805 family)
LTGGTAKLRALLSLAGRISRLRFWFALVVEFIALLLLGAVFYVYALSIPGAYENGGPTSLPTGPLGETLAALWFIALAALLWGLIRTCVRRLHDRGKSGWWLLLFTAAPNAVVSTTHQLVMRTVVPDGAVKALLLVALALFLWGVTEMGVLPGDVGDNRFGPGLSSRPIS